MWYKLIAVGFVTLSFPAYAALPVDEANRLDSALLPVFANSTMTTGENLIRVADFTRALKKGVKRLKRLGRRTNAPPAGNAAPINAPPPGVAAPSQPLGGAAGQFGAGAPSGPSGPSIGSSNNQYGTLNISPPPSQRNLPSPAGQYDSTSVPLNNRAGYDSVDVPLGSQRLNGGKGGAATQPQYGNLTLGPPPSGRSLPQPGSQQVRNQYDAPSQRLGGGSQPQYSNTGLNQRPAPYDAPPGSTRGAGQQQYSNAGLNQRPAPYDAPPQQGGRALPAPGARQVGASAAGASPQQYDAVSTSLSGGALPPPSGRNLGGAAPAQPPQYDAASSAIGSGRPLPPPGSTGPIDPNNPWPLPPVRQ